MAFADPERCKQRRCLLMKLKNLLSQIDDDHHNRDNHHSDDCGNSGAVIEIYDPLPKPAVQTCEPVVCCPASCPPPKAPTPYILPACLPICTPAAPPCIPICNPYPTEQPCVPCNPPQMMVCYRRPKEQHNKLKSSKSRELRASILYIGCDCEKRNGLQDDCRRSECFGSPPCLTKPDPTCGPSEFANGKHLYKKQQSGRGGYQNGKDLEEYQCYPAYIRLPTSNARPSCPPPCPVQAPPQCSYVIPLCAQPPCPPCPVARSPVVMPASFSPPLCLQPPAIYCAPVCPCPC